ncbi:MAG: hypothetical protein R3F62_31870 [Planctomycetota bacterium]
MGSDDTPTPGLGPLAMLGVLVLIGGVCSALAFLLDRSVRESEGKHYFVSNQAGVVYYPTPAPVNSVAPSTSDVQDH